MTAHERVAQLVEIFPEVYPGAHCELDYANPLQLLVATILSAQCTDKRVNLVTPALFQRYPDARAFAAADLVERHGGRVPGTMDELVLLAGIGRKSANVVLGNAFDVQGIPVDTHVGRLS